MQIEKHLTMQTLTKNLLERSREIDNSLEKATRMDQGLLKHNQQETLEERGGFDQSRKDNTKKELENSFPKHKRLKKLNGHFYFPVATAGKHGEDSA